MATTTELTIGFIPLLDSAILIAASEAGFAEAEGLKLQLVRETSWANIRDRVAVGHFDGAHLLAPMSIAFNLGITPLTTPVVAPMALGLGGNAITVTNALYDEMRVFGDIDMMRPTQTGAALRSVVKARKAANQRRLVFAVVHPYSGHNYELRYWLGACRISPVHDIEIVVVPPPLMPDALKSGTIDGYCVGEPWNSISAIDGTGRIVTVKAAIWRSSPEKVLGLSQRFVERKPEAVEALIRACYRASEWCANPDNAHKLAGLLATKAWLGVDPAYILPALTGNIPDHDGQVVRIDDFFLPHQRAATFPWQSHALWFYTQMVRWGHASFSPRNAEIARDSFRPDIYRRALAPLNAPVPAANLKVEGALSGPLHVGASGSGLIIGPDGFFDGRIFDPDDIEGYLRSFG
jgi:NitT/TauT family transport system ATP-binding protein